MASRDCACPTVLVVGSTLIVAHANLKAAANAFVSRGSKDIGKMIVR
jgi:hypothetical protein